MKRRTVIAALGGSVAAAGCLGRPEASGDDPDTPAKGTDGDETASDTRTDGAPADGTPPVDPVADVDCPDRPEADRTVCWPHEDGQSLELSASSAVLEPSADEGVPTVTFTLRNRTGESFGLNPYDWRIDRWTGSAWEHVAPDVHVEPWTQVPDGGTHEWVLSREQHPAPRSENTRTVVEDLGTGTYAFTVSGLLGGDDEEPGERVACTALFVVRGG